MKRYQYQALTKAARELALERSPRDGTTPDMSGNWADTPSGPDVYRAIAARAGVKIAAADFWDGFDAVLDVYEDTYRDARPGTPDDYGLAS